MSRREQALARASKRLKGVEGARLCPFAEQETADQQSGHTGLGAPTGHPWGWTLGGDPALSARSGTTSRTSPGVPGTALDSEAAVDRPLFLDHLLLPCFLRPHLSSRLQLATWHAGAMQRDLSSLPSFCSGLRLHVVRATALVQQPPRHCRPPRTVRHPWA